MNQTNSYAGAGSADYAAAPGRVRIIWGDNHGGTCGTGGALITGVAAFQVRFFNASGSAIGDYPAEMVGFYTAAVVVDQAFPTDYYAGGSAGPVTHTAPAAVVCSRKIGQQSGTTYPVEFKSGGTPAPVTNESDAYAWAFGDSTTGTQKNPSHSYTRSAQPDNGYTATVTLTRTLTGGDTFAGGATTATKTCSLRVDYANPDQSEPATTSDSVEETCLPSGWDWLNPAALVEMFPCLFIPTADPTAAFDDASDKVPFSVVTQGTEGFAWVRSAISSGLATSPCAYFSLSGGMSNLGGAFQAQTGATNGETGALTNKLNGFGELRLPTPSSAGCPAMASASGAVRSGSSGDDQMGDLWGFRETIRAVLVGALYLFALWRVIKAFGPKPTGLEPGSADGGAT